jgi:hypothetical protein
VLIENSEKSRARSDLHFSIKNDLTMLHDLEDRINSALVMLQNLLSGSTSGFERNAKDVLERTRLHIADIRRALNLAQSLLDRLDVMEEVNVMVEMGETGGF